MNTQPTPVAARVASVRLVQCATPWSMIGHPSAGREWSLARKLRAVRDAGFDGVCAIATAELRRAAAGEGLRLMSGLACASAAEARPQILSQARLGVRYVTMQLMAHDTTPAAAVAEFIKMRRLAARHGVDLHVETHRATATETPEKFEELARRYRTRTGELLPVTWDHSHFAVMKHILPEDFGSRLLCWPALIQHSRIFHLRPFSSQHCQVPVTNGRGRLTPEFQAYLCFVEALFGVWLAGHAVGELWTCPELGMTHGYHVSTNPPTWPDAVRARAEFAAAWHRVLRRHPTTSA